jgi:integrase
MAERPTKRRRRHGSAWYWKQTESWYYTANGERLPLFDEEGKRVRGVGAKQAAGLALARVRLRQGLNPTSEQEPTAPNEAWSVAKVCSKYIDHCRTAVSGGRMSDEYRKGIVYFLNEFCRHCGALAVTELKRGHVTAWLDSRPTWRSPVTHRNVITMILAAFKHAETEHGVRNPLKGLKKPPSRPRLQSISPADEQVIYGATDEAFKNFLFAALHTGLRPFCELAKLTAAHVEETPRGMMWRVHSSKTKKTRRIPVRPEVAKLTRKLLKEAPTTESPVFRNPQGNAWKKVTGVHRFLKLKRELGWIAPDSRSRYSTYSCRHTFAHRMLSGYWNGGAGCSIEVLAELIGDTPKVAFDHYGREWGQHYQEPLWAALGQSAPQSPPKSRSRPR